MLLYHGYNNMNRNGRAIAQAVGRRLIAADARLNHSLVRMGFMADKSGTGTGILQVLTLSVLFYQYSTFIV
jgi:hypothetical protein